MNREKVIALLQALAVGDSFGKSTEFATRADIKKKFKEIDHFLTAEEALAHRDMRYAQVTDDTEQNFFFIEDYARAGEITPEVAARSILRWYEETPEPEKYIGPSSRKAIYALKEGVPISQAGCTGTSCGGIMRAPVAFLCSSTLEELEENVFSTLCPTHNTPTAMEAAMGYAFALWAAWQGQSISQIQELALIGCRRGRERFGPEADYGCQPSCDERLLHLQRIWDSFSTQDELLDFLFYVYGTTISSCDVFSASMAIFLWAEKDVFLAVRMAAVLGGDTDTIGCLAAALCCAYAGGHNIPEELVSAVEENNPLNLTELAEKVLSFH